MEDPNREKENHLILERGKGLVSFQLQGRIATDFWTGSELGRGKAPLNLFNERRNGITRHYQFKGSKVLQDLYFLIKSIACVWKQYLFGLFGNSDYSCRWQKIGKDFLSVHKLLNVEWVITSCGRSWIVYGKCVLTFEWCEIWRAFMFYKRLFELWLCLCRRLYSLW